MNLQRAIEYFERLVERVVARLDYHGRYSARVIGQANDGSLELVPDDARVPPEAGAAMRTGLPGVTIRVPQGVRVQLAYENGDPRKPVVGAWASGTADEIAIAVGGSPAVEHLITTEAVGAILVALGALVTPPLTPAQVAGAFSAAAAAGLDPATAAAIKAAFEAAGTKPPAVGGQQLAPGIGCKGLLSG